MFRRKTQRELVIASDSGSQSHTTLSPSALLNTKSTITQNLRIAQKNSQIQKLRSEHWASFEMNIIFDVFWSVKTLEKCGHNHY